jgi:thiamine-phosphate pyrophosphorylase
LKFKAKFIYLISPININAKFFYKLESVLKSNKVYYFQLRLKNTPEHKIISYSIKIKKICKKYKVKFIINDNPRIAKKVAADGCHIGQSDTNVSETRKILRNKIIGVTCHNSKKLAKKAIKDGADYVAIGAFNISKTKRTKYKAGLSDLIKIRKISNKPIVAIGGINQKNYKKLLLNKADFLAISSFIWKNKKLKPEEAIEKIK